MEINKQYRREALVLAVAAPAIAELLSGSARPLMFFVPWVFILFVMFYGGAAIVIRELTFRWNTGWLGILLMGAAFGILQEGCSTRAFFDPAWPSLGPMVNHGRWLGVNWFWMFDAILYHATYSISLPILFVYQLFPESQHKTWLSAPAVVFVFAVFAVALAVWLYSGRDRYQPPPSYLWISAGVGGLLCIEAWRTRAAKLAGPATTIKPRWLAILGFVITAVMVLQIYVVPQVRSVVLTATVFLALVSASVYLVRRWSGLGAWTLDQQFGLIAGIFTCFALLDFFQEVNPARAGGARGASLVGITALAALWWMHWRRKHVINRLTEKCHFPGDVKQPPSSWEMK